LSTLLESTLVTGGTEKQTPQELALALDENAVDISVSIGEEASTVRLSVLQSEWEKGLALLMPAFDPGVLTAAKDQIVTGLKRQGEDARTVAFREAARWHFQGHPYGRDPLAAIETVPKISVEDMRAFLQRYFVPANMVIAASGDIDRQRLTTGLRSFLDSLPQHQPPIRRMPDPKATPPVLTLIHKPGQVQAQVVLTLPGIKRSNAHFWDLSLLSQIYGGGDSLLYNRLRSDLGLVYAAQFYETYKWQAGLLQGYLGCKSDLTAESLSEAVKIMSSLGNAIPQRPFELKRLDLLNSFVFNVDSPAALTSVYANYFLRQEPLDTLDRIQDAFIGAQRDTLRQLAQTYLDPSQLQIFVVADGTTAVKRDGAEPVPLSEDLRRLAQALGLPFDTHPLR
jgi:zinc protease